MIVAIVVVCALALTIGAFVYGRKSATIVVGTPVADRVANARYRVEIEGVTDAVEGDSQQASQAIEAARAQGRVWRLLVDGVVKKQG